MEAEKYQVLPLDDRLSERADPTLRPSLIEGRTSFTYYPGQVRIPESSSAPIKNRSHTITAHVEIPPGGADGVLVAAGGAVGGYVLYIKDGRPTYEYNWYTQARYRVTGSSFSISVNQLTKGTMGTPAAHAIGFLLELIIRLVDRELRLEQLTA